MKNKKKPAATSNIEIKLLKSCCQRMVFVPNFARLLFQGGRCHKRQKGNNEDRGGREVTGNIWAQTTPRSLNSKMPGPLTLGPARGTWTRCRRCSWKKVAGSRTREVLEKGGEGTHSRNCPRLEIIQNWIRQARLDQITYLLQCFSAIIFIKVL